MFQTLKRFQTIFLWGYRIFGIVYTIQKGILLLKRFHFSIQTTKKVAGLLRRIS